MTATFKNILHMSNKRWHRISCV